MRFIMKLPLLILATLCAVSLHANDVLRNGDFSRGTGSWKGDRRVVTEGEAKYLQVDLDRRKHKEFSQDKLSVKGADRVVLTFRYRTSEDYESSKGITLRFLRPNAGSTYRDLKITASPDWKTHTWDFSRIRGADELTFLIEVHEGKGSIMFDDFSAIVQ